MKRTLAVIICGAFCLAAANELARQGHRVTTSVRDSSLFDIVRDGGAVELIAALLGGGDVNSKDDAGMSLLHHAAQLGRDDMVEILRRHGADAGATDNNNSTALQLAQQGKHTKVIELLSADSTDTTVGDDDGCDNALHLAAMAGDIAEVERLLAEGVDVNTMDNLGRTALHYAALRGDSSIVNLLIANNANLESEDNFGNTPLAAAQFAKQQQVVTVLEQQVEQQTAKSASLRKKALAVRAKNKTCPRRWR